MSTFILDNKYIVDIHGASYGFNSDSYYTQAYASNLLVSSVRSSQQKEDAEGKKVLRVVFDLINPAATYYLTPSTDLQSLSFSMDANNLQAVSLEQNEVGDFIKLTGTNAPDVKAFRLSNPDRIVFDLPNTITLLNYQSQEGVEGQYVKSIRTAQFEPKMARVVIETEGQADYTITKVDGQTTIIQLLEPSYDNINYTSEEHPVIALENASEIDIASVTYDDRYYEKKFIIQLPGNFENIFGEGGIQVEDPYISSINIETDATTGYTNIVIRENDIYVFKMEKDENGIYIKGYKPKEVYSKIIILDFGHGGKDPGAVANGLYEKDINLSIGNMVKGYMQSDPTVKVYYTRRDDTYIALQERTDLANAVEADFFVSIHNNAFTSKHTGTETIYFKDSNSGFSSVKLAKIMHAYMVGAIGLHDRGIKDNNSLFVLKNTNMPAVILEGAFLTHATDSKLLANPVVQDRIAKAIYDGIQDTFIQYPTGR